MSEAIALLEARYEVRRHEVAAAARLEDGRVVTGIHVEASQGRASICAESGVASAAVAVGLRVVSLVAVVRRPDGTDHLIEPCGVCAELLAEMWPSARVWAGKAGDPAAVTAEELLPYRHQRIGRLTTPFKEDPA
ncbi:cytidine deaminase family protein [Demequina flava]|uniref:cytidine deaminase family protein n=1 Tax=Demequina flava TaxID=1095025 RepID=UPI001364A9B0|nr:cytidine deaminase [Demequina flava]